MERKSAGEYLEEIGWGKYNLFVFIQCGAAWTTDMMWSANVAYVLEGSQADYGLSGLETGLLGACFPFGLMVGAFIWGVTGDKYGRMYAFKTTVIIATVFSLLLTVSVHPVMTAFCLFFLGAGMGGELSLGGTVFCEFCPPSKLYYLTRMALFWGLGGTLSALIALITTITNNTSISTWRYIVGSGFIIEVICLCFRFLLEETPAFCQESGQIQRMEGVLTNVARKNTNVDIVFDERLRSTNKESITSIEQVRDTGSLALIKRLFVGGNLKLVLVYGLMYSSAAFAYTSILYFMPEFLKSLSTTTAYAIILLQQACSVPGVMLGSWLVETRFGRRFTILFSFMLAAVCCFLFYIETNIISVIVNTSIMNLVAIMGYSAVYTITPESYSTDVRNLGVGAANICARVSGVICPIFTGWLLTQSGGFQVAITLFAALFAVTALSALLLKETRPSAENKGLLH